MLIDVIAITHQESTSHRIMMHLSFPPEQSVNSGIPTNTYLGEPYRLCLPGVDALVTLIQAFRSGSLLFKKDLHRAYCQLPIILRDYHFMGYSWDNVMFLTLFLPLAFGQLPCHVSARLIVSLTCFCSVDTCALLTLTILRVVTLQT